MSSGRLKAVTGALNSFMCAGLDPREDCENARKAMLLNAVYLVAIGFASAYAIMSARAGNYFVAMSDGLLMVFAAVSLLVLRYTRQVKILVAVTSLVMGFFFLTLYFTGGVEKTGLLWVCCFPPMVFFFMGTRAGGVLLSVYSVIVIAAALLPGFPFMTAGYEPVMRLRFVGSYLAIVIVSFLYEFARTTIQKHNREQNLRLVAALTELASADSRIRESEERLRDIMLSSSDVIWETDSGGCYQYLGGRVAKVLGYEPDDLLGRSLVELEADDSAESIRSLFWQNEPSIDDSFNFTHWVRHKNGHRVCIHTTGVAFKRGGVLLGYRGVDKDITGQQHAEREREAIQSRLQAAQKMEAIGQLAGGIAHDFNNILGAISGYADMIRHRFGADNPKLLKYAETILSAATRAADLTSKLLAFARKGRAQVMHTDMDRMLRDLAQLLSASFDKKISIHYQPNAPAAVINADPSQMHEVLMNLAVNARDAMPDGGKLLLETDAAVLNEDFIVKHQYQMSPGAYLIISVSDNGLGMSAGVREHIFEPFFTTKEKGVSSGMGLASVYGIVKTHRGGINVYSEEGRGTTVKIYLPLAQQPEAVKPAEPAATAGSARVLVVDDEHFMLDICTEMLESLGFSCVVFDNGTDALAYMGRNQIDLALIDMVMGDMDGIELLAGIQTAAPAVPVVLCSGFTLTHERAELLQKGFCDIIQKPFVMQKLAETINRALAG